MRRALISSLSLFVLVNCGDGGGDMMMTRMTSRVTINGVNAIRTGFESTYTAVATYTDGTMETVSPTWTSSDMAVATIDSGGRLSGLSHGSTTLTATHEGRNGTKTVQVVNNYAGTWTGTYIIRACDQSGVFIEAEWCEGLGGAGAILPIMLAFSQSGDDQRQMSGSITLGTGITGNITGSVRADGALVLEGSFTIEADGVTFEFTFGGWTTRLIAPGQMTGRWAQSQRAIGVPGNAYQEVEIVTMVQTSTGASISSVPSHYRLSWSELFEAIRH